MNVPVFEAQFLVARAASLQEDSYWSCPVMLGADSLGPADLSSYSLRSECHCFQLIVLINNWLIKRFASSLLHNRTMCLSLSNQESSVEIRDHSLSFRKLNVNNECYR